MVRSRKPKKLQNMTTRLVLEGTSNFKAQESSTVRQACKSVQFDCMLIIHCHKVKSFLTKAVILKQLERDRQSAKQLNIVTRYYFRVPLSASHETHPVGEAGTVGHC